VVSSTQITVVSPAHTKASVRITVTTPDGTSSASTASAFEYQIGTARVRPPPTTVSGLWGNRTLAAHPRR
jgi:hypothetical protein